MNNSLYYLTQLRYKIQPLAHMLFHKLLNGLRIHPPILNVDLNVTVNAGISKISFAINSCKQNLYDNNST